MADDRDPAWAAPPEASWADYYQHTLGRELRPPFVRGVRVLREAGVGPAQAVEVGFGDGEETLALLAAGWRVLAIDASPEAAEVLRPRVPAGSRTASRSAPRRWKTPSCRRSTCCMRATRCRSSRRRRSTASGLTHSIARTRADTSS